MPGDRLDLAGHRQGRDAAAQGAGSGPNSEPFHQHAPLALADHRQGVGHHAQGDRRHRQPASGAACHCDRWLWPDAHRGAGPQTNGPRPDAARGLGDWDRGSGLGSRREPAKAWAAQDAGQQVQAAAQAAQQAQAPLPPQALARVGAQGPRALA